MNAKQVKLLIDSKVSKEVIEALQALEETKEPKATKAVKKMEYIRHYIKDTSNGFKVGSTVEVNEQHIQNVLKTKADEKAIKEVLRLLKSGVIVGVSVFKNASIYYKKELIGKVVQNDKGDYVINK
jgi:hypothetical protein